MEIVVSGRTDKGLVRLKNEDNFYIDDKGGLLVVADGMGGHTPGEIASKIAVDVIRDYFKMFKEGRATLIGEYHDKNSEMTNMIASSIRLANSAIYDAARSNPVWHGMGTTVAAVAINGKAYEYCPWWWQQGLSHSGQ